MSVTKGVGIPVKLLHEAEGHIVTVRIPEKHRFSRENSCLCWALADNALSFPPARRSS